MTESIVLDRDTRFVSQLWRNLQQSVGTKLNFSTSFHPQSDGQSERVIQTLEDMLRACVLDYGDGWYRYLPLVEFAYNNSYQASVGIAPYEALYGYRCRSPICWDDIGERRIIWSGLVEDAKPKFGLRGSSCWPHRAGKRATWTSAGATLSSKLVTICCLKCHQLGESNSSDCGTSLVHGSWDPSRYLSASVQWHIGWLFLRVSPVWNFAKIDYYFKFWWFSSNF